MLEKWQEWMINDYHSFTNSGSIKRASYVEICQWIDKCWNKITPNCITNEFKVENICEYQEVESTAVSPHAIDHIEN